MEKFCRERGVFVFFLLILPTRFRKHFLSWNICHKRATTNSWPNYIKWKALSCRRFGRQLPSFEYHAAKREQARLLSRIRFKQKVLANARVIDVSRLGTDSVQLLSKVQMTNLANNKTMTYTIASPNEANLREGKISIKSPIAQALLNKKVGDEVEVRVPAGLLKLRIEKIELS